MSAANPFCQGSVPPSLPLMSWWSSLHFCQDQSLLLHHWKLPGLTLDGCDCDASWCIVMRGCWSLLCCMVWSHDLWIWMFHSKSLIPSIQEYHEALCCVGDLDVYWSQAGLGLKFRSDTTNGIRSLACTINFQGFSSAGPSQLVVLASKSQFQSQNISWFLARAVRGEETLFRAFWSPNRAQRHLTLNPTAARILPGLTKFPTSPRSWEAGFTSQQRHRRGMIRGCTSLKPGSLIEVRSFKGCASCTSNFKAIKLVSPWSASAG